MADALAPEVMREEFTNIIFARAGGKLSRQKCYDMVDSIITKQMQFYTAAETETQLVADTTDSVGIFGALGDLQAAAESMTRLGASTTPFMTSSERSQWQHSAMRMREGLNRLLALLT